MSTDDGDDDGGDSSAPWYFDPPALIAVVMASFIGVVAVLWFLCWLVKSRYIWWRDRRAKSKQPVDDGQELLERRETIEDHRKSEGSIDTCYEFAKPVENNSRLEV